MSTLPLIGILGVANEMDWQTRSGVSQNSISALSNTYKQPLFQQAHSSAPSLVDTLQPARAKDF
jgi:hypothetical protein